MSTERFFRFFKRFPAENPNMFIYFCLIYTGCFLFWIWSKLFFVICQLHSQLLGSLKLVFYVCFFFYSIAFTGVEKLLFYRFFLYIARPLDKTVSVVLKWVQRFVMMMIDVLYKCFWCMFRQRYIVSDLLQQNSANALDSDDYFCSV